MDLKENPSSILRENLTYETDIRYTVNVTRGVLSLIGAWPTPRNSSILRNVLMKFLKFLCLLLLYFILIPGLLKMFLVESNPRRRLKMVGPMCNCTMAILKYSILVLRSSEILECLKYVEIDWKNVDGKDERKTMMQFAKIGRNLAIFCVAFVYGSGFSFRTIVPLTKGTIVTPQNVTIRPLGLPGYYVFFDHQSTPGYEIVFSIQLIAGFVQYSVTSGAVSLTALFVLHACGQLKILMSRLEDLTVIEGDGRSSAKKKLSIVVEHHIKIKSFLTLVEDVLHQMCLVEVIGCTLILCLLGYYIIMEWEDSDSVAMLTYTFLLIRFTFNIFIFCFIGELLNDQGMKVYLTTCTLNWYQIPDRTARSLVLVIAMSSSPIKLTAGKFMDLSLNSFGAIVRTSMAYLNMLRATSI